ncbi:MAG: hypothetical protein WCS75_07920 [Sphingomonas sp.]|jgi:plasmid stability protein|uniref:hypothetical protein n=1 Tax=Sphingomonas sp. TaxID=28214 RepID=UPI003565A073
MEQAIVRRLRPGTLDLYRAAARRAGRSLEAELRALIEANAPLPVKDSAALLALSDEALAMTPPDGPVSSSDSTVLIRWDRDTGGGRWIDDGWLDDAGR